MNLSTLKKEITDSIKIDRLDKAFELFNEYLDENSDYRNELTLYEAKYSRTKKRARMGKLSYENSELTINELIDSLLQFLEELKENDLAKRPNKIKANKISDKILVFVPNEENEKELEKYFSDLNFNNITFSNYESDTNAEDFVLVVYDNRDLPDSRKADEQQKQIIQLRTDFMESRLKENPYSVHFGNVLFWIDRHRDYVHAANSRFALFARIKEMLEFIKA